MKPKDDEKQRAIAQATFELGAQTGLSGLTMADIARAAGIATSTLYVYYPSKDELISQLYQDAKTVTAARIMEGVVPGLPYRARVRRAWGNLLRHRLDQYAEVVFQEQYYNSPWFTEGNREFSTRLMAGFFALMEEGQQQEILKAVPPTACNWCSWKARISWIPCARSWRGDWTSGPRGRGFRRGSEGKRSP